MPSPKKSLTLIGVTPPEPHITATSVRTDIRATEGATRRIPGGYYTEKPMSKLATRRDEGYSFQPRISLTSPDFGNDSDPDANDDPSPLSLRALRRDGVAAKTKVHFERMATNRDRRKTTGGIGIRFGETSSSMHQTNFAPPPALRSPEKPPLDSDPIQMDSEEEDPPEDDSPLLATHRHLGWRLHLLSSPCQKMYPVRQLVEFPLVDARVHRLLFPCPSSCIRLISRRGSQLWPSLVGVRRLVDWVCKI